MHYLDGHKMNSNECLTISGGNLFNVVLTAAVKNKARAAVFAIGISSHGSSV